MNMSENKFTQRIDVLDLLIEVLRQHEKTLDQLITRLEEAVNRFVSQ